MANPPFLLELGSDLLVTPFFEADEWHTVDLVRRPEGLVYRDEPVDLALARGVESLQQALVLRLLTPQGSLGDLGHADYGSRLQELIGAENTSTTRLRARAFILQAIAQEPRVEEVLALSVVTPTDGASDRLLVSCTVRPVSGPAFNLDLEVGL